MHAISHTIIRPMPIDWKHYNARGIWDELITPGGRARPGAGALARVLAALTDEELASRKAAAELAIRSMGITFTVYSEEGSGSIDREWPFDIVPRLILKKEWDEVERGLKQRVTALNRFIDDIYHDQRVLEDGVMPREYIEKSRESDRNVSASIRLTACGRTFAAPISCATKTARSMCSRTTCASLRVSPTCSRIAR